MALEVKDVFLNCRDTFYLPGINRMSWPNLILLKNHRPLEFLPLPGLTSPKANKIIRPPCFFHEKLEKEIFTSGVLFLQEGNLPYNSSVYFVYFGVSIYT